MRCIDKIIIAKIAKMKSSCCSDVQYESINTEIKHLELEGILALEVEKINEIFIKYGIAKTITT